jgi:hypothetical protein
MSISKCQWLENEHDNPDNWITKKCSHCNENYKVNKVTKTEKCPINGWCNDCYYRIVLGSK